MLGPNGAGKSTLFNLVTGGERPDAGRIVYAGEDVTRMAPHLRCRAGIARSYQAPHPFANMTVFENLLVGAAFGSAARGREAERHCGRVLEHTGLLPLATFAAAVAVIAVLQTFLYRTRTGRAFRAASDRPEVVPLMGVDNRKVFALAMGIALAVCAVAGVLMAVRTNVSPTVGPARLLFAFEAVIIGGIGCIEGPLVGALVFFALRALLADLGSLYLVILGALAVGVMLKAPQGLWGLARERFGLALFPVQRRLVVPPEKPGACTASCGGDADAPRPRRGFMRRFTSNGARPARPGKPEEDPR